MVAIGKREYTQARAEANKRWDAANYLQIAVRLPKDLVLQFRSKCERTGQSQAGIIKEAIENFLGD